MKRQIRSSVFETNSSSTHSIAIPKDCNVLTNIHFSVGEFGWAFEEVDPADYFYTAIHDTSYTMDELDEKLYKFKQILERNNIEATFDDTHCHTNYGWLSHDGYIDHGSELGWFVNELLDDEDRLLRFLSGGLVFTGNDNSDSNGFISRNEEFIEDYDWRSRTISKRRNPYYMRNHANYEWEYKGN